MLPLTVPFVQRFSRRLLIRLVLFTSMVTGLVMAAFCMRSPFDAMHQKRLYIIHMENVRALLGHRYPLPMLTALLTILDYKRGTASARRRGGRGSRLPHTGCRHRGGIQRPWRHADHRRYG